MGIIKRILILIFIFFSVMSTARAQGGKGRKSTEEKVNALKTSLNLTDDQVTKITDIIEFRNKQMDSVRKAADADINAVMFNFQAFRLQTETLIQNVLTHDQASLYKKQLYEQFEHVGGGMNVTKPYHKAFKFPPPKGYALNVLPDQIFNNCKTMSDVDRLLCSALAKCRYDDKSYYGIPHGFALLTKVEEINEDGTSIKGADRFAMNVRDAMDWKSFFTTKKGYFRVFAFLVTNVSFSPTIEPVNAEIAEDWVYAGLNTLPNDIAKLAYNNDYHCSVVIYEFKSKDVNAALTPIIPAKISGKVHVEKAHLFDTGN